MARSPLLAAAAVAAVIATAAARCTPQRQPQAGDNWVLAWSDDFEGDTLNTNYWNVNNYTSVISQYDGHDALFTADRVALSGNGSLVITTVLQPQSFNGVQYNMTSGWLDTQGKVSQSVQDGPVRFEASMKMPDAGAQGAWPAFWLLPVNACWPISGEVDIIEWWGGMGHYQHNKPGNPISMASTYHYGYSCSDDKSDYNIDSRWFPNMSCTDCPLVDFSADFHTFGVEINATALRFYVDGNTSFVRELPQLCMAPGNNITWGQSAYMPFNPLYVIFDVAVSPNSNTSWWETHNATTLVDWVKVWTLSPSDSTAPSGGALGLGGALRGAGDAADGWVCAEEA